MTRLRMTDCEKWDDPWYMELPGTMKLLWLYICDKCDNAGVWKVNQRLAQLHIGDTPAWRDAQEVFKGRIVVLPGGEKWFLPKFLAFQHPGGLGDGSAWHRQVLRLLESHGIDVSAFPFLIRVGGRVAGTVGTGAEKRQATSPSPSSGGAGGKSAVTAHALLAEFGLPASPAALAEWKGGLNRIAKVRSLDEARCFMRWAIGRCKQDGVVVEHWRHVRLLAADWDDHKRAELCTASAQASP